MEIVYIYIIYSSIQLHGEFFLPFIENYKSFTNMLSIYLPIDKGWRNILWFFSSIFKVRKSKWSNDEYILYMYIVHEIHIMLKNSLLKMWHGKSAQYPNT